MLHASGLAIDWRSMFMALVHARHDPRSEALPPDGEVPGGSGDRTDDEREPFHLDDTELATRLVRDRGLVRYHTPPHTHLIFPALPEQ